MVYAEYLSSQKISNKYCMQQLSKSQIYFLIFILFVVIRTLFYFLSGYDSFELISDSARYDALSNQMLAGNFNLNIGPFIVAPFYPYLLYIVKLLTGDFWLSTIVIIQIVISSVSGVFLYRLAMLLFNNRNVALLGALLFAFFPTTLWYTHTLSQECLFQALLIFAIYYLVNGLRLFRLRDFVLSALFFSFCFLTKSHILLFSPFILLYILNANRNVKLFTRVKYGLVFTVICLLFTVPYGVYNLKVNDSYVFSSNGVSMFYFLGHNEEAYQFLANTPEYGTQEYVKLMKEGVFYDYIENGKRHGLLSQREQSAEFIMMASEWIESNRSKNRKLMKVNFMRFFTPGVSKAHYPFNKWLVVFVLSVPIYFLAYFAIMVSLKNNFSFHFWILGLVVVMLIFSVVFYFQARFRVVTLEPFYLMYSAFAIHLIMNRIRSKVVT